MDTYSLLGLFASSLVTSSTGAVWLSKKLVEQMLQRDIEKRKSELQASLEKQKAELEGAVKERVETVLADRAACREYDLEARKRLYLAIGPIRFQLLLACRDLVGRIVSYGRGLRYSTSASDHYGQSMLFRVLRPLTLTELAEREIAYADFTIEPSAINLLKFKKQAFAVFSGPSLVVGHPHIDWTDEIEHVFFDRISRAANALIVKGGASPDRCMRSGDFVDLLNSPKGMEEIAPFPRIFEDFKPEKKPLFWLRLVAYAYLCNEYINRNGTEIGFERRPFPLEELLAKTDDPDISRELDKYVKRCERIPESPL